MATSHGKYIILYTTFNSNILPRAITTKVKFPVKPCHVLIISQNALFLEALARLMQAAGATIQARVADLQMALPFFHNQSVNAIIVDQSALSATEWDIVSCLANYKEPYRVIFLQPDGDHMTVYCREQKRYTTPESLTQLLCMSE